MLPWITAGEHDDRWFHRPQGRDHMLHQMNYGMIKTATLPYFINKIIQRMMGYSDVNDRN